MFGLKPASEHELAHSEEELRLLLSESYKSGEINQSELKYVNNIFEFDERTAKEIMIPRTEMITISEDAKVEDLLQMTVFEQYTRYPVALDGDKDNIVGLVNIKEILSDVVLDKNLKKKGIKTYTKPIIQVIETSSINDLLRLMQKNRTHMAILIDEYGGTACLVTAEDILEEIVGEIQDEFDTDEVLDVQRIDENHYIFNSKILLEDVNSLLGIDIAHEDIDTLGGWVLSQKIDVQINDILSYQGYEFIVRDLEGHKIKEIEVKKNHEFAHNGNN
jgi:CBS domain containing-hemolysin-like protein